MRKQVVNDLYGADDAAQRLRNILRDAFMKRTALHNEFPLGAEKSRPANTKAVGKNKKPTY